MLVVVVLKCKKGYRMEKKNIVLIGMPSAGKSTIGKILAEKKGKNFVDTDIVIKNKQNMPLRDIVNTQGLAKFLEIQETAILEMNVENHIIATGGSVVYSNVAMDHLKNLGVVVYLKLDFSVIEERVAPDRRFARKSEQSLLDLYNERTPLYEEYSDIIIDCSNMSEEETAIKVLKHFE
jgi:shikimate kinase